MRTHLLPRPGGRVNAGLLVLLVMTIAGCGGKPSATVTGTVTYQGAKVPSAKVTFISPDYQPVTTSTDPEGNYKAEVPLGDAKVTVSTARQGPSAEQAAKNPVLKQKGYVPSGEKTVSIPPWYADPRKSTLTLTVKEGPQTFDIPLK